MLLKEKVEEEPVDASSVEELAAGGAASCSDEDEGVIRVGSGSGAFDSGSIRLFGQCVAK